MNTEVSDLNINDDCEEKNREPNIQSMPECSNMADTQKLPVMTPETPVGNYQNFWDVCPENIVDLPDADTFKAAVRNLRLPQIICGKPYECAIKLFTCNNSFENRIQLINLSIVNNSDFIVETNVKKSVIHIKGTAKNEGELKIRIEYKAVNSLFSVGSACNEVVKSLIIQPDPLIAKNQEFQKFLKVGDFEPVPEIGTVGEYYDCGLDISDNISVFGNKIKLQRCDVSPQKELTATIDENGVLSIVGTPITSGTLSLILHYSLELFNGVCENMVEIPFTTIAPDPVLVKWDELAKTLSQITPRRTMAGENISFEFSLPEYCNSAWMTVEKLDASDTQLSVNYDEDSKKISVAGTPQNPGTISLSLTATLITRSEGDVVKTVEFPVLFATPDPKTLWKNIPTDPAAPYQSPDEEHIIIRAGERTVVAASKRGRSHAHDGKFRDDNFKVDYIEKTGWFIIAVSDGAGSAKFSREGSRIACQTFWEIMYEKLSSDAVNEKINGMDTAERESALKNTVLTAVYQGLSKIDAEAKQAADKISGVSRKDYSATFLGYVMKQFADSWLIVSIGIGDGIIGLIDRKDDLILLSEPDGGEFVGQTRFITMNEVWQKNPIARTRSVNVNDFGIIMSMSDGVSDPKFETDNNLKNRQLWLDLWNDIVDQVPLMDRSEETALKLSEWLDFWAKGNHDDRTIVLVY